MHAEQALFLFSSASNVLINHVKKIPKSFDKILIIKLDEIGDMLYTLHCLQAIRKAYVSSEITLYCKPVNVPLLQHIQVVNRIVHSYPTKNKFDLILDLRGDWQTLLKAIFSRVPFRFDRGTIRLKNKINGGQKHEVFTNWEAIKPILTKATEFFYPAITYTKEDEHNVEELIDQLLGKTEFVVMHCGARDEARRWPAIRFAQLGTWINKHFQIPVVLVGTPNEIELNNSVLAAYSGSQMYNIAGKTSLSELAVLMHKSTFFVGNESGPLHFAVLLKKPLVALFGPGVKNVFYPLFPNQKVIHHFKEKGHTKQTVEDSTMFKIAVEEVQNAILSVSR